MNKELLSIVVPCFNEEEAIPIYYRETKKILDSMDIDYELLFIDDGSKYNSLLEMINLSKRDERVFYYSFPATLARKQLCMLGLRMPKENM